MLSTCMAFWYTETKHVICFVILCLIRCPFHMHWYVHLVLIPSFLSASKQKQQKHKIHLPCSNWSEYSPNGSNVKIPLYCSIFGQDKRRLITGRPCTSVIILSHKTRKKLLELASASLPGWRNLLMSDWQRVEGRMGLTPTNDTLN